MCQNFSDLDLLHYLEKTLSKDQEQTFEAHLHHCDECLKELIELNRINAIMDSGKPNTMHAPRFIIMRMIENAFGEIATSFSNYKRIPLTQTRENDVSARETITFSEGDYQLDIQAVGEGQYWITLRFRETPSTPVSLTKLGDSAPLFYKQSEGLSIVIKGVRGGVYELSVLGETVRIELGDDSGAVS